MDLDNAYSPQVILFAKQNPLNETNVLYSGFFEEFKITRINVSIHLVMLFILWMFKELHASKFGVN